MQCCPKQPGTSLESLLMLGALNPLPCYVDISRLLPSSACPKTIRHRIPIPVSGREKEEREGVTTPANGMTRELHLLLLFTSH